MGWKAVRDHYRIGHIVHVIGDDLVVGSGMAPRVITVTPDGEVRVDLGIRNGEIGRIADEMRADKSKLLELMSAEDAFERSIPVHTWRDGAMVERFCEETGWPNVTHDGDLMYENRYSEDRAEALAWAREDAASAVEGYARMADEARRDLAQCEERLARAVRNRAALDAVEG